MSTDKIIGYKGFNKHLQCTPDGNVFQYEVGKTYEEPEAVPCKRGFHFCKNPFFVWDFYGIFESRFCVVEADAANVIDHENKSVTKKITIKAELSLGAFVNECVAYMIDLCDPKKVDVSDANAAKIGSSGYAAQIGSSGDAAQIGSSGYAAKIGSSGDAAKIGSSGYAAKIGSSGYAAKIGSSGDAAQIGSSGDAAKIGSSGYAAKIGSSGYAAQIDCSGNDSVVAAIGKYSSVKAAKGCWIVLAEYDSDGVPLCVKSVKIDGDTLKENTAYTLKNGEFCEVTE